MPWVDTRPNPSREWRCGYCGNRVAGMSGYYRTADGGEAPDRIYVCPYCENPTAFIGGDGGDVAQIPGPLYGSDVRGLPESVSALYDEVRACVRAGAYTSAVLSARKLLMHVAVEKGAKPKDSFVSYVDFLYESHYVPPNGREWVDEIRDVGNEATHEIVLKDELDAMQLLDFCEMLLRFVYEYPSRVRHR